MLASERAPCPRLTPLRTLRAPCLLEGVERPAPKCTMSIDLVDFGFAFFTRKSAWGTRKGHGTTLEDEFQQLLNFTSSRTHTTEPPKGPRVRSGVDLVELGVRGAVGLVDLGLLDLGLLLRSGPVLELLPHLRDVALVPLERPARALPRLVLLRGDAPQELPQGAAVRPE